MTSIPIANPTPYIGAKLANVAPMFISPVEAEPDPAIPAKIGITMNWIASASNAKSGMIMITRLSDTALDTDIVFFSTLLSSCCPILVDCDL